MYKSIRINGIKSAETKFVYKLILSSNINFFYWYETYTTGRERYYEMGLQDSISMHVHHMHLICLHCLLYCVNIYIYIHTCIYN